MSIRIIRQLIRSRQQELVELAASFIRIPSENPSPEFKKRLAEMGRHISRYLAAKGFLITEHRRSENALVTVVCDAPLTRVPGPRLLFCGHTDVVPAGNCSHWTFDPFSGELLPLRMKRLAALRSFHRHSDGGGPLVHQSDKHHP
ncbi:hypothetical protein [Peribacillus simplex]|uniref:hypothetical protein n=1 Tax=Peribacillus simplex TaxID=1478 RepID=UPI0011A0CD08|nr:hypothetical protein [Peribacillus simplex]